MSRPRSHTPAEIPIQARSPEFDLGDALANDWLGGDPFKTAWFNALSLTFPVGERFFIDAVRAFEDMIDDPDLSQRVRGFVGQEAQHRRVHQRYNEQLCQLRGYDLQTLEEPAKRRTEWAKAHVSRYQWLAVTVAYEHLTAIIADEMLRDPQWLEGADPRIAAIWDWHAVEETEHKSVAFDVYRAVGGYERVRRATLRIATTQLLRDVLLGVYRLLRTDGRHLDLRIWWSGFQFLLGSPGLLRQLAPQWRSFKRPGFHPWKRNNRDLVNAWIEAHN